MAGVSRERLERHFVRRGSSWQVNPELRSMVVFARHNAIRDPPFTRMDLVSCRNMLIYLQTAAQQKVLGLFRFALVRRGVLFLGPSESIANLSDDSRPSIVNGGCTASSTTRGISSSREPCHRGDPTVE